MHSFEVHSNESACRKKVRLGMEQGIHPNIYRMKPYCKMMSSLYIECSQGDIINKYIIIIR